jgi:predicted permease
MNKLRKIRNHITGRRPNVRELPIDESVDREISAHFEMAIQDLVALGRSPDDARAEVLRRFGDAEGVRRACRRETRAGDRLLRRHEFFTGWFQDLVHAGRLLRRSPGFTLIAIGILALGIGANTAVFSFFRSLLVRIPPVREPERLVYVFPRWEGGIRFGNLSPPEYRSLKEATTVFSDFITETPIPLNVSIEGQNERVWGAIVSAGYFTALGVDLRFGGGFTPAEESEAGEPLIILGHEFWRRRFSSDPGVIGRSILINGRTFSVAGVAPMEFRDLNGGMEPALWAPFGQRFALMPGNPYLDARGQRWMALNVGRLAADVTLEQAQVAGDAIIARLRREMPEIYADQRFVLLPFAEAMPQPEFRREVGSFMGVMWVVVGLILLLACANIAGLLLAQTASRRQEIGIRLALGVSRSRLGRQFVTEGLLLAGLAAAAGLLVGILFRDAIQRIPLPGDLPLVIRGSLDLPILLFTLTVAVLTGILFSVTPVFFAMHQDPMTSLKENRRFDRIGGLGLRRLLVTGQVALSLVLLLAAGLVLRSLYNLNRADPGFEPDRHVVASIDLDLQGYREDEGRIFIRRLREKLQALPGVASVGFGRTLPLYGVGGNRTGFRPEGGELPPDFRNPAVEFNYVDSGYFPAMGLAVQQGRTFTPAEDDQPSRGIVINESLARLFWPGRDPVGQRAWIGIGGSGFEIIGVVRDVKYASLGESGRLGMYLPFGTFYSGETCIHLRTHERPEPFLETLRSTIASLDPSLPVYNLRTMEEHLTASLMPARFAAVSISAFALLALLLASVGLYGVIAYWVHQQAREIGVRMAIGATTGEIIRNLVRQGMMMVMAGLIGGLALGLPMMLGMRSLLYGLRPLDPMAMIAALAVLITAAFFACYLPARGTTRVDPAAVLRMG